MLLFQENFETERHSISTHGKSWKLSCSFSHTFLSQSNQKAITRQVLCNDQTFFCATMSLKELITKQQGDKASFFIIHERVS